MSREQAGLSRVEQLEQENQILRVQDTRNERARVAANEEAAKLAARLSEVEAERDRLCAEHHALGNWPDCPTCLNYFRQDENGAALNAKLTEELAAAQAKLAEVEAERDKARRLLGVEAKANIEWRDKHRDELAAAQALTQKLAVALHGLLELTVSTSALRAHGIDTTKLTMANLRAGAALALLPEAQQKEAKP